MVGADVRDKDVGTCTDNMFPKVSDSCSSSQFNGTSTLRGSFISKELVLLRSKMENRLLL